MSDTGPLRTMARAAVVAGAAGSVGLMAVAGHPPIFLRVIFVVWVLSPFVMLALADRIWGRWPDSTRTVLHVLAIIIAAGSLAIYGFRVWRPPASTPAFVFVMVPPLFWLLIAAVVSFVAFTSRQRSR